MLIWILDDYNISKYSAFNNLINRFSKIYPEININFQIKSKKNMWQSIFNFLKFPNNNEIADIIEIPHNWTSLFSKLGAFMEIRYYYEDFKLDDYPDFLKEGIYLEGTNYSFSIPFWLEIITLHYRTDMLKPFTKNKDIEFLSWDDFLYICEELKKKNRKKNFYPLDNFNLSGVISSDDVLMTVLNRSDGYFSVDYTVSEIIKDEVIVGIEDFLMLVINKYLPVFEENFYETGFLKTGLSAMAFSWRLPSEFGKLKLSAVQFPQIRRKINLARSYNLTLSASTKNIDECKIFIKWLFSMDNIEYFCKSFKVFSPNKKELMENFNGLKVYSNIYSNLKLTPSFSVYPTFKILFDNLLFNLCYDIVRGKYERNKMLKDLILLKGEIDYLISNY